MASRMLLESGAKKKSLGFMFAMRKQLALQLEPKHTLLES